MGQRKLEAGIRDAATSRGMPGVPKADRIKRGPSRAERIWSEYFQSLHLCVSKFLLFEIRTLLKLWPFAPATPGNETVASVLKATVSPSLKWIQIGIHSPKFTQ